ncbi:MAG: hypothetical protein Q8L23_17780 [Caulobacter sp.]|nr:hypothetical protein [Caulobacter sp.]
MDDPAASGRGANVRFCSDVPDGIRIEAVFIPQYLAEVDAVLARTVVG